MKAINRKWIPLGLAAAILVSFGCSNGQVQAPTQTSPRAQDATAPMQLQSQTGDRKVLDVPTPPSMDDLAKILPSKISAADASRLLIQIDPSKIQGLDDSKNYQVQVRGGHGGFHGGFGRFGHGFGRFGRFGFGGFGPFGFGGWGGWGWGGLGWPWWGYSGLWNNLWWYPYGGYYYPYSYLYGGTGYYPYLYGGLGGLYNPYFYRFW
jgi:hypothetical protein